MGVMASYSEFEGVPIHASRAVLTELLRGRMGFTGTVVSDYNGARVWVVGDMFDTDAKNQPKKSTALTATGYGVVDETPVH